MTLLLPVLLPSGLAAQEQPFSQIQFTRYDTLRGKLTHFRSCYDVHFYDLALRINPEQRYIKGSNQIYFTVEEPFDTLQVDLFSNLKIDSITDRQQRLPFFRDSNAVFVIFPERQKAGALKSITIFYQGTPKVAVKPPWDGGFVWSKDSLGNPWIAVACEGLGASVWWPNKDHLSDEPDSMRMRFEVPQGLMCVSNGTERKTERLEDGYDRHTWFVHYPINNYNVTVNIAKYAHIADTFQQNGNALPLDYYVLAYNVERAKQHFKQVKPMLRCFEKWFGSYPFPKDGYALVEAPYWGMEHQGAIAYGNHYKNLDYGFDFIIIHESGHEWFGNSLSVGDHAEMWLHEGFTTYMEAIYLECTQGKETAQKYLNMQRQLIGNLEPLIGPVDVNFGDWQKGTDIYYKGTWILHTFRNMLDNDSLWKTLLYDWATKNRYQTVTTDDWVDFVNAETGQDYTAFFDQYLRNASLPVLIYKLKEKRGEFQIEYRWQADVPGFSMPVKIVANQKEFLLYPVTTEWKTQSLGKAKRNQFRVPVEKYLIKVQEGE